MRRKEDGYLEEKNDLDLPLEEVLETNLVFLMTWLDNNLTLEAERANTVSRIVFAKSKEYGANNYAIYELNWRVKNSHAIQKYGRLICSRLDQYIQLMDKSPYMIIIIILERFESLLTIVLLLRCVWNKKMFLSRNIIGYKIDCPYRK